MLPVELTDVLVAILSDSFLTPSETLNRMKERRPEVIRTASRVSISFSAGGESDGGQFTVRGNAIQGIITERSSARIY